MRIISWNCQGIGMPLTQSRLFRLFRMYNYDILFLVETLNQCDKVCKLAYDLGFPNVITQPPNGRSGGLALMWKNNVSLSLISQDERLIDSHVTFNNKSFYLSCVYGHPTQSERHQLWQTLEHISDNRNAEWLLVGDFNEILSNAEKIGGPMREEWTFRNFRNMVSHCDIEDMRSKGDRFSWVGERHTHTVKCCLDRVFINSAWTATFPYAETEFLDFTGSDHKPVLVHFNESFPRRSKLFRFDNRLIDIPTFKRIVQTSWRTNWNSRSTPITERISSCRQAMARLKHASNLNSEQRIKKLQSSLNRAMESTRRVDRQLIPQLQESLAKAFSDEEIYWKQKSRNQWMKEGDQNTGYFHACTKTRYSQNRVNTIMDDQGRMFTGDKEIGNHAQDFFTNIFSTNGIKVSPIDFADFKSTVTNTVNLDLTKEFSDTEIYDAICQIGDDKAPGPDGLTARFYKNCWDIVGYDVILEVKKFFETSFMKPSINHTNICMIPKITNPTTLSDYRPIALCNVLYKVISKCLVNRLKSHLNSIVSDSQAAFIPGRIINDNVMIAHEVMHSLKVRKRVSKTYMAVKTDVSKAYDRVEWDFLETTMRLFGFCNKWIGWIMAAVKSVHYSVLINGSPHGYITPTRGIRQGDPLSPYLFILCGDILSHLINGRASSGDLRGVRIGNGAPAITHLQFADDSLFFCQANVRNCQALKDVFDVYEYYSGQKINVQKSMITFGSRVYGSTQSRLKQILEIPNQGGGGKYLGLPEQFGRKKKEMFEYIIDRVKKRTSTWSARFLSPAGKEIMLKSVALAMPVYAMSCFKLPKGIVSEIESLLMNFWWEKASNQRGIPWVAWKRLQYSKKEGGLGFRDLAKFNDALLAKQAWRLIQYPNSLFARVMKARYFKDVSILDAKVRKQQSYGWASLLDGIALLKKGTRHLIGDGQNIRIGLDNIVDSHPPRPLNTEETYKEMTINNLFERKGSYYFWDDSKISQFVDQSDHGFIHRIYLAKSKKPDKIIWNYNTTGEYTVRSGYWLLTHDPSTNIPAINPPHGSIDLKTRIWNLPIMPKLKHFLWRALSQALATTERLTTRGMRIDPSCPRCHRENESINHALFTCPFATMAWRLSDSSLIRNQLMSNDFEENISNILNFVQDTTMSDFHKLLPVWLIWRIWKARNNVVFNKFRESPSKTVLSAKAETHDWLNATQSHKKTPSPTRQIAENKIEWRNPPATYVKCNFDAGFDVQKLEATGGWIIRNHYGTPISWGSMKLAHTSNPLEAETKALLAALQQTWIRGYTQVFMEGDCQTLINLINGTSFHSSLANHLEDISFWANKFASIQFGFIRRKGNKLAHVLAKYGCTYSTFYSGSGSLPIWLDRYFCNDSN